MKAVTVRPGSTEATTAKAIQRYTAGADIKPGIQCRHAPQVTTLLPLLGTGSPNDVINFFGVYVVAFLEGLEYNSSQMLRMHVHQSALAYFSSSARRSNRIDDKRFGHGFALSSV